MNRLLYAVNIPEDALINPQSSQQSLLATNPILGDSSGAVQDIASEPGERAVVGTVTGRFATLTALELEELFGSDLVVPYTPRGAANSEITGYYATEQLTLNRGSPASDRLQQFDGTLIRRGTKTSHYRALRTNPQPVNNPFGSATAPEIGLSIRARKVRWFDPVGGAVADATPQRRVEGEHDYLDIYDASEPSFSNPALIYDIPYTQEYPTDCTVWDTYNRPKVYREPESGDTVGSTTVGDGTVSGDEVYVASQWQRVYVTDHDWRGDMVLETDRLRLVIDQPEDVLRAYRWSPTDGQWTLVQLGASDWRLYDIDITEIGLARCEAQLEFRDTDAGRHNLNVTLLRGLDEAVVTVPPNESTPPQDLLDRLAPIAATTDRVPVPSQDVIKRTEVDR
jgi:hypothetical protein